jgi:molecular chaperone GrpE
MGHGRCTPSPLPRTFTDRRSACRTRLAILSHVQIEMTQHERTDFDSEGEPDSDDAFARAAGATPQDDGVVDDPPTAGASAELERRLADQQDRYLRLAAEYDNFRKRTTRERAELQARAQGDLVRQFLDALDDLSRFAHVDPATVDAATLAQGDEMVEM